MGEFPVGAPHRTAQGVNWQLTARRPLTCQFAPPPGTAQGLNWQLTTHQPIRIPIISSPEPSHSTEYDRTAQTRPEGGSAPF